VTRPTGWLPDPAPSAELLGAGRAHVATLAASDLPDAGGIERAPWILSQTGESCTGHFGAQALHLLGAKQHSPYHPWAFARAYDAGGVDRIRDTGCSAGAFTRALREHGACSWDDWHPGAENFAIVPREDDRFAALPPALARLRAQRFNLDLMPLYGSGDELVRAVAAELHAGHPVGLVVHADAEFQRLRFEDEVPREPADGPGDHIGTLSRFRRWGDGSLRFLFTNSWGVTWSSGGMAWLPESWVRASSLVISARGYS